MLNVIDEFTASAWRSGSIGNRSRLLALEHVRARFSEIPCDVLVMAEVARCSRNLRRTLFDKRRRVAAGMQFLRALGSAPAAAAVMSRLIRRSVGAFVRIRLRGPPSA